MFLTSETTSWDMSLWIAARHSWVILGSLVPQPIRNGCTTSELFSFRAEEEPIHGHAVNTLDGCSKTNTYNRTNLLECILLSFACFNEV